MFKLICYKFILCSILSKKCFIYLSGWSAPSAIGIAGIGGGFEIGAEVIFCNLVHVYKIHKL
jgi:lipid-binding SYLF domain-containing protein